MSGVTSTASRMMPPLPAAWSAEIDGHVISLAWSPTGGKLAAASIEGPITVFEAEGAARLTLPGHAAGTSIIAWSSDGKHFASGGQDGRIHLWDIAAREPKRTLAGGAPWVEHLAWNPLGGKNGVPHLLASAAGRKLRLWNAEGEIVREFEDHPSTIASIAWKPASQFLTTAAYSRLALYVPALEKAQRQFEWKGSILTIAWAYMLLMSGSGMTRATQVAILNANYIACRLADHYPLLFRGKYGRVAHECIIDIRPFKATADISVDDVAKRLIDYGFHAPTMSFPVAGTLMIEPTESESRREIDRFCDAMVAIRGEIRDIESGLMRRDDNPLKRAPHTAFDLADEAWTRPYARALGCFPAESQRGDKYWPPVNRIDNAYGDRNLACSCVPVEDYQSAAE